MNRTEVFEADYLMHRSEFDDEYWDGAVETDDYSWLDAEDNERMIERDAELMGAAFDLGEES